MSQAGMTGSGAPEPTVITLNGDSSFATGATISIVTGVSVDNSGATFQFDGNGTTTLLLNVTDADGNTTIGKDAGNVTMSGEGNSGFGNQTLGSLTTGELNSALGANALVSITSGTQNSAFGFGAGQNLISGSGNLLLGRSAGSAFLGAEASNIILNSTGTTGESNTLRIGLSTGSSAFQLNRAFISGINGVTSSNALMVTINSATDQLGVTAIPGVDGIQTIDGDTGSATGLTILLTALDGTNNSGASVQFNALGSTVVLNVTDSSDNTFIGKDSGNSTLTGTDNVGLGNSVLNGVTSGTFNVGIGNNALLLNSSGSFNIAIGHSALSTTTTQNNNIGIGYQSLRVLDGGAQNLSIGNAALANSTLDNNNIAIGTQTLTLLDGGSQNVIIGQTAMVTSTADNQNIGLGNFALHDLNGGDNNVALGHSAGDNLATGEYNIYVGLLGGTLNTTSESSNIYLNTPGVALESNALRIGAATGTTAQQLNKAFICGINGVTSSNPLMVTINSVTNQLGVAAIPSGGSIVIDGDTGSATGTTILFTGLDGALNSGATVRFSASGTTVVLNVTDADDNTIIGNDAGNLTLTGTDNVGLGHSVLAALTTGQGNIAIGNLALSDAEDAASNIAIGSNALSSSVSDSGNLAIGHSALTLQDGGGQNIAIGNSAMSSSLTTQFNTAIGLSTLASLGSGQQNTAVGFNAGISLATGSYNVFLGSGAGVLANSSESSNIYLNNFGVIAESNALRIGVSTGTGDQELSTAFIHGINGVTLGGTPLMVTIDSTTSQLGVSTLPTGGFAWLDITVSPQAIVSGDGYVTDNAATVTYSLPATPAFGDTFAITGGVSAAATAPWIITQNAGQQINYGASSTTIGVTGSLAATLKFDSIELVCVVAGASARWTVLNSVGNITVT